MHGKVESSGDGSSIPPVDDAGGDELRETQRYVYGHEVVELDTPETLRTADGPVECLVIVRRGRDVTTWISKTVGHIVRMRWTNADGSVTWKMPGRDLPFRN